MERRSHLRSSLPSPAVLVRFLGSMAAPTHLRQLVLEPITSAAFAPFGQAIFPQADGLPFGPQDAQLQLGGGTPRFYLMTLTHRGHRFRTITRHQRCTQCLGALGGQAWWLAVAPPSVDPQPNPDQIRAFHIPGDCLVKLSVGTWHAGPYFSQPQVSFYNLELSDTNLTDHYTCHLERAFGLEFEIVA
jgi:ureidoglycolate hydrolase